MINDYDVIFWVIKIKFEEFQKHYKYDKILQKLEIFSLNMIALSKLAYWIIFLSQLDLKVIYHKKIEEIIWMLWIEYQIIVMRIGIMELLFVKNKLYWSFTIFIQIINLVYHIICLLPRSYPKMTLFFYTNTNDIFLDKF